MTAKRSIDETVSARTPRGASTLHLPAPAERDAAGPWATVLDALSACFGAVSRDTWHERMARGRVLDATGRALGPAHPYREGLRVHYFREVATEVPIPFAVRVLHADEHLLVADKPHFMPVAPVGRFVRETLLTRLIAQTGNDALVPLHRIDRDTAGIVLFSTSTASRAAYHALFRDRRLGKYYEALAALPPDGAGDAHVVERRSRLVRGEPFFRMQETAGPANSETRIELLGAHAGLWRYGLQPRTGRKHQLRVHMAAIGAPIVNDVLYPALRARLPDDFTRPLQLLARRVWFVDPLSGVVRRFDSTLRLPGLAASPVSAAAGPLGEA